MPRVPERNVGGTPLIHCETGVTADTPVDVAISCDFIPDYIKFVPDVGATNPNAYEYFLGMTASAEAMLTTGSTGVTTLVADNTFELDSDGLGFVVCSEIQTTDDDKSWSVIAMRYSQ